MSNYLALNTFLVDIGTTLENWKAEFKLMLTNQGWQVLSDTAITGGYSVDVFPPVTETIGNANAYEVVRIQFFATYMTIGGAMISKIATLEKNRFIWTGFTTGTATITIGGTSVSQAAIPGNTINQNLALLLTSLQASTDPNFTQFNWSIMTDYINSPDINIIEALAKSSTAQTATTVDSSGFVLNLAPVAIGEYLNGSYRAQTNLGIDFSAGFIYYLNVNSRSFIFSTKTNTGFYGPQGAEYVDHAEALANTPNGCTPIELVVVDITSQKGYVTHGFGCVMHFQFEPRIGFGSIPTFYDTYELNYNLWTQAIDNSHDAHNLIDISVANDNGSLWNYYIVTGPFAANLASNFSDISSISSNSTEFSDSIYSKFAIIIPPMNSNDMFSYNTVGTTDESLLIVRSLQTTTTIVTAIVDSNPIATLGLLDGSGFVSSGGSFIIGNEIFSYTGKSDANTLTGVTRGQLGSTSTPYTVGTTVYLGQYFVKINGAAIQAGLTSPQ